MSDVNVSYNYESLETFKSSKYNLPKAIQIVPVFRLADGSETYGLFTLNNLQCISDFGSSFNGNKSLDTHIADCIKYNSLNTIMVSDEYISTNTDVAYSTSYDVSKGEVTLSYNPLPIFFVNFMIKSVEDLNNILYKFKIKFASKLKGVIASTSDTTNLIYASPVEIFYICRNTTYSITDKNEDVVKFNIEESGFPARDDISLIYKSNSELGEIPCSDKYNEFANCCPEVEFYNNRAVSLGDSFVRFFERNLPIL